jgi:hypothetical protein
MNSIDDDDKFFEKVKMRYLSHYLKFTYSIFLIKMKCVPIPPLPF